MSAGRTDGQNLDVNSAAARSRLPKLTVGKVLGKRPALKLMTFLANKNPSTVQNVPRDERDTVNTLSEAFQQKSAFLHINIRHSITFRQYPSSYAFLINFRQLNRRNNVLRLFRHRITVSVRWLSAVIADSVNPAKVRKSSIIDELR